MPQSMAVEKERERRTSREQGVHIYTPIKNPNIFNILPVEHVKNCPFTVCLDYFSVVMIINL